MTVSYARHFTGGWGDNFLPPAGTPARGLHEILMTFRDRDHAHSDVDAGGKEIITEADGLLHGRVGPGHGSPILRPSQPWYVYEVDRDRNAPPNLDWGLGRYESTAEQLLPAARVLIDSAQLRADERVIDLGCGTGNAALLAAACGARVIGVDPAARLLDVARGRAASEGATITFLSGEAASIPLGDGSADVIVSVFAVIFAPDAVAAAAEMSRVVTADGRIILSAWIPQGTIFEFTSAAGEAVRQAVGAPSPPPPFAWHDPHALSDLLAPHGFAVEIEEHSLSFIANSPTAYLDGESRDHPLAVAGLGVLQALGQAEVVRERLLQILVAGNEDPVGFRTTSRYIVAKARRTTG
jgi:SAM-dependent methyltransferase